MGRSYLFECPKCAYRAKVSGGADRGLHFAVQTVLCVECKELFDAVTGLKLPAPKPAPLNAGARIRAPKALSPPPAFSTVANCLPPAGVRRLVWVSFAPACPVSARHRVREWNQPGKCPRCGIFLEPSAIPFRLWD